MSWIFVVSIAGSFCRTSPNAAARITPEIGLTTLSMRVVTSASMSEQYSNERVVLIRRQSRIVSPSM